MHITLNKKAYSGGNGAREGAEEHSSSGSEELVFHFVRLIWCSLKSEIKIMKGKSSRNEADAVDI